jgi:hypothetical protein
MIYSRLLFFSVLSAKEVFSLRTSSISTDYRKPHKVEETLTEQRGGIFCYTQNLPLSVLKLRKQHTETRFGAWVQMHPVQGPTTRRRVICNLVYKCAYSAHSPNLEQCMSNGQTHWFISVWLPQIPVQVGGPTTRTEFSQNAHRKYIAQFTRIRFSSYPTLATHHNTKPYLMDLNNIRTQHNLVKREV